MDAPAAPVAPAPAAPTSAALDDLGARVSRAEGAALAIAVVVVVGFVVLFVVGRAAARDTAPTDAKEQL